MAQLVCRGSIMVMQRFRKPQSEGSIPSRGYKMIIGKSKKDHRSLALSAADCAERVLPFFEKECLGDGRPRKAIEAARAWARGEIKISEARAAAFAAHAAARDTNHSAARAAARAAGHAAATAHVAGHAQHAANYAAAAAEAAGIIGEQLAMQATLTLEK